MQCSRCKSIYANSQSYCTTCGYFGLFFEVPARMSGEDCFRHIGLPASRFCVLCARPICDECRAREGFSFLSLVPTTQCIECVTTMEALQAAYFSNLRSAGFCPNHPKAPLQHSCISCGLSFCDECLAFTSRGLLRRRPDAGPYCRTCFQMKLPLREFTRKISAADPRAKNAITRARS